MSNVVLLIVGTPDTQVPFVPEPPENLVVLMEPMGVSISCRVSNPDSHVVLRSVPSGEEMQVFYDNKMGFFGSLSPGQYQCETVVNSRTLKSQVYTVEEEGESLLKHLDSGSDAVKGLKAGMEFFSFPIKKNKKLNMAQLEIIPGVCCMTSLHERHGIMSLSQG